MGLTSPQLKMASKRTSTIVCVHFHYTLCSLLILVLTNSSEFQASEVEGAGKSTQKILFFVTCNFVSYSLGDDPELQRQILALDNYVYTQMITKQPNTTTPPSDVPDLSIFTQLYEAAADRMKSAGICSACKIGIGFLMYKVRNQAFNNYSILQMGKFVFLLCGS